MCMAAAAPIMAVAGAGLNAFGAIQQNEAQRADIDRYNAQVYQNGIEASRAASQKYADEGLRYSYNMRDLQQQGYKSVMEARRATGTAVASAGSSGVSGSSLSVEGILSDIDQQNAENLSRIKSKQDDSKLAYMNNNKSAESEARGRINSMQPKSYPSTAAMGLNIATGFLNAGTKIAGLPS